MFWVLSDKLSFHLPVYSHTEHTIQKVTDPFGHTNREPVSSYTNKPIPQHKASVYQHENSKGNTDEFSSILTDCAFFFLEYVKDGYDDVNMTPSMLPDSITDGKKSLCEIN